MSQCRAQLGIEGHRPQAGDRPACSGPPARRDEERLDGVAVAAVVAAHVLDVTEDAVGSLRQRGHRARDHPPRHLGRDRHQQERGPRPRNSAYWTVRSAPGGRSNMSRSSAPHSKEPRISPRRANSLVARQVCDSPGAALSNSSDADSGTSVPIEKTPIPLLVRGSATFWRAGNEQRPLDTGHSRLRGAVEVRVEDRDPQPPGAQRAGEMQRQGALADSPLAGAHGH